MSITCRKCLTSNDNDAKYCKQCGVQAEKEAICNMCGFSCILGCEAHPCQGNHGLINQSVSGGYESTPGNGHGALDDCTHYTFSLCEFCLDWLFSQFKVHVAIGSYTSDEPETWKPAAQRVAEDDWRKMKKEFQEEHDKRAAARKAR